MTIEELIAQIQGRQAGMFGKPALPVGMSQPNQPLPQPNAMPNFSNGPYTQLAQQMSGLFGPAGGQAPPIGNPQPPGVRIPTPQGPGGILGGGNYRNDQFGGFLGGRRSINNPRPY